MLHTFWPCRKQKQFWTQVCYTIKQPTDFDLGTDPARYLLHHSDLTRCRYNCSMLVYLTSNAAKAVWERDCPPTFLLWLTQIADIHAMESITAALRGNEEKFNKTWFYWTQYICSRD